MGDSVRAFVPVICVAWSLLAGCTCEDDRSGEAVHPPSDSMAATREDKMAVDATLFIEAHGIEEVARDFPFVAGMTVRQLDELKRWQKSLLNDALMEEQYLVREHGRRIHAGQGWIHFSTNGKAFLYVFVFVKNGVVTSVWVVPQDLALVVPGKFEWYAYVVCRISGHDTAMPAFSEEFAVDQSRIQSDDDLRKIVHREDIDRMYLTGEVTDKGLALLPSFTSLTALSIDGYNVTDEGFKLLADVDGLQKLSFHSGTVSTEGLKAIRLMTSLEQISLAQNENVTDDVVKQLAALPRLRIVDLGLCKHITDAGVEHLAKVNSLEDLRLADCELVTDRAIPALIRMKNLRLVSLLFTGVTPAGAQQLTSARPDCRVIF